MNLSTLVQFTQFGRVFPLGTHTKKPMRGWRWQTLNSDDVEIIAEWVDTYPSANWALVPVRAFVVDVDIKAGSKGPESINSIGGLEPTFTVRTPSGGSHHYYAPDVQVPFATRNSWLPGVDVRYGNNGYVVLPYSATPNGRYEPEIDLDELPVDGIKRSSDESILSPIPDCIRTRWTEQKSAPDSSMPPTELYERSDTWSGIRDQVWYMFFRNRKNGRIWNHLPLDSMNDTTKSGFEWQLAWRWMTVGATDDEVMMAYRLWCGKHGFPVHDRFTRTIPRARLKVAPYIAEWKAKQPVRRKHGTTTAAIYDAIQSGATLPKDITQQTGLKGSTVRMHLKRLIEAGKLTKTASRYAIADVSSSATTSLAA